MDGVPCSPIPLQAVQQPQHNHRLSLSGSTNKEIGWLVFGCGQEETEVLSGEKRELLFQPECSLCFQILSSCPDIKWHFIGHLQKNNVNKLIGKS